MSLLAPATSTFSARPIPDHPRRSEPGTTHQE